MKESDKTKLVEIYTELRVFNPDEEPDSDDQEDLEDTPNDNNRAADLIYYDLYEPVEKAFKSLNDPELSKLFPPEELTKLHNMLLTSRRMIATRLGKV